ncbi:hypothetical protein T492DRAFT_985011 [Pavlovales sp. CCMP2436]|nr:hypothetical protein T492DRAFT_985011 [Pavlovales sp. CCMP2436]|mmetsp:Transcript_5019/g.13003  ORF Transcript_5019/g.13003 Transcript_5019/m.13003 type:complete len:201 (+) Transcript_5019:82-684(+)
MEGALKSLKRARKDWIIRDLVERFERSKLVIISHLGHMPVSKIDALRTQLEAAGGGLKLVKSSLGRKAAEQLNLPIISSFFRGPAVVLHSGASGDMETAKIALGFAKANPEMIIVGGKLDGQQLLHTHLELLVTLKPERVWGELLGAIHPATYASQIIRMTDPSTHLQLPRVSQYLALTLEAHVRQQAAASGAESPAAGA